MAHENSLVLYKNRPARVKRVENRLEIETDEGELLKVRPKDVALLHPGPLRSLRELVSLPGDVHDVQSAWEILAGSETTLSELAELVYGAYTPVTAWAAWQLVAEGLYFRGTPDKIAACTPDEVAHKQAAREAEAAEKRAWAAFLGRVKAGQVVPDAESARYLREVEELALGKRSTSRLLRELGRDESQENAHALLLDLGWWDSTLNPYPSRLGLSVSLPTVEVPDVPDEARADLTHLPAFAVDDEDAETPDDALSLEGNRLWVHVADVAALVRPGSPLDLEARARGATLHLPEQIVHMLPLDALQRLALGLTEVSPALSFGLDVSEDGHIAGMEVVPSWVRVTRCTYEQAEKQLDQPPFNRLYHLAQLYQARRREGGAVSLQLPEVRIRVKDGQVMLRRLLPLRSRMLVQEAMLMAGEAAARFAVERDVPLPFSTQEPSEVPDRQPDSFSDMIALRRALKRRQFKIVPDQHAGLGLAAYAQATSPLRRYLDLVVHQQVRAFLRGEERLSAPEVLERIGGVEGAGNSLRQAELLSEKHWTLVYLLQHPGWRGEGIVVEKRGPSSAVLIPELALETSVHLPRDVPLDSPVRLALSGVNLARLEAHFFQTLTIVPPA